VLGGLVDASIQLCSLCVAKLAKQAVDPHFVSVCPKPVAVCVGLLAHASLLV